MFWGHCNALKPSARTGSIHRSPSKTLRPPRSPPKPRMPLTLHPIIFRLLSNGLNPSSTPWSQPSAGNGCAAMQRLPAARPSCWCWTSLCSTRPAPRPTWMRWPWCRRARTRSASACWPGQEWSPRSSRPFWPAKCPMPTSGLSQTTSSIRWVGWGGVGLGGQGTGWARSSRAPHPDPFIRTHHLSTHPPDP